MEIIPEKSQFLLKTFIDMRIFSEDVMRVILERDQLLNAIKLHHSQKADDRCIEDDDKLYEAAGLPKCDRRVGSKEEMLKNCARFIEKRCEEGKWPTYAELEANIKELEARIEKLLKY